MASTPAMSNPAPDGSDDLLESFPARDYDKGGTGDGTDDGVDSFEKPGTNNTSAPSLKSVTTSKKPSMDDSQRLGAGGTIFRSLKKVIADMASEECPTGGNGKPAQGGARAAPPPSPPQPNPLPDPQPQPPHLSEAERLRRRQKQMEQEIATRSGTKDHRPLVGGFAAAAYEVTRADHFEGANSMPEQRTQDRKLPTI